MTEMNSDMKIVKEVGTHPLSVKYRFKSLVQWNVGWGVSESMEGALKIIAASDNKGLYVRQAIFFVFMKNEVFRRAVSLFKPQQSDISLLELDEIDEEVAMLYVQELVNIRDDANKAREASPSEYLEFLGISNIWGNNFDPLVVPRYSQNAEAELTRWVGLAKYNKDYKGLAKYFLAAYGNHVIRPTNLSGFPSFLFPASFIGFCGVSSNALSFSVVEEAFADGCVEIECNKWHGLELFMKVEREFWDMEDVSFPIEEDWSSGVTIKDMYEQSIILALDQSAIKDAIPFGSRMVPVSECGNYIITLMKFGDFQINIYYRSKSMEKRTLVYTDEFSFDFPK